MSEREPFRTKGAMPLKAACVEVFTGLEPGAWIEFGDLKDQVEKLTGVTDWSDDTVRSSAWHAGEQLAKDGVPSIEWYQHGYRRLDTDGQINAVNRRVKRSRRAVRRTVVWAQSALANPEIAGAERHQLEQVARVTLALDDLKARRAERARVRGITP